MPRMANIVFAQKLVLSHFASDSNYEDYNDDDDRQSQNNPMDMNRDDYFRPMMNSRNNLNSNNQFGSK